MDRHRSTPCNIRAPTFRVGHTLNNATPAIELDNDTRLDALYTAYLNRLFLSATIDRQRHIDICNALTRVKTVQDQIDAETKELDIISKQIEEIDLVSKDEKLHKYKFETYKPIAEAIEDSTIDEVMSIFERESRSLPLKNFQLPETLKEATNIQKTMVDISSKLELQKIHKDEIMFLGEFSNNLYELIVAFKSLQDIKDSCKQKMNILNELINETLSLEIRRFQI